MTTTLTQRTDVRPIGVVEPAPAGAFTSEHPFEDERIGAAAVYCSDGRWGDQIDEFLHHGLGLPRYDRVAVPGGAACLASHFLFSREESAMERQLRFLIAAHDLDEVVLIAHQDCAFYKQLRLHERSIQDQQFRDLATVARRVTALASHLTVSAYFARKVGGFIRFEPVGV